MITTGTLLGLGAESDWGTEVARSVWWRVESVDIQRKATHTPVNTLSGVSTSAVRDESVLTKEDVTGTIRGPMSYRGMGLILKHALGAVADSGSDPYTHAYTHTIALQTGLTAEVLRGNTAVAEELLGLRISKLTLEVMANGYMTWEIEVIGKTGNSRASGGSPSLTTPYRILGYHCPGAVWNSATQKWTRMKFTIDNKLTAVNECGSLFTSAPERGDMATVETEIEFYPSSNDWYTAHLAGTSSDLVMTFTEPSTSETFTIRAHAAKIVEYSDPLTAPGLITGRALFRGHASGSNLGAALTAINNQSSGVA